MEKTMNNENDIGAEIDVTLHKTDFGDLILKHKNIFIATLVILFVTALSYAFYTSYQNSQAIKKSAEIETIYEAAIAPFLKDPTKIDELTAELAKIDKAILASGAFQIYGAEMVQKLFELGHNKHAAAFLQSVVDASDKTQYMTHLYAHQLVVALENTGELAQAEAVLNDLLKTGKKFMQDKLYFDLARVSAALDKKDQAAKNYQFIIDQFPKSQYREYAEIMLQDHK